MSQWVVVGLWAGMLWGSLQTRWMLYRQHQRRMDYLTGHRQLPRLRLHEPGWWWVAQDYHGRHR